MVDISDFVNKLVKEYGEKVVVDFNKKEDLIVIPTSSVGLNIATRVGGIPLRTISEIYGREGSGKSTLSLDIIKNFLKKFDDRYVMYVDVENMMSTEYVKNIVGEEYLDRFILTQPLTSEDALTVAESAIDNGNFGVVVVDSIGALSPKKEVESPLDKDSYSGSAKLIARFLRRVVPKINHNNVALVLINQVRDPVGSYVSALTTPGGHSIKHFASLRIMLSDTQKIKSGNDIIGNVVKYIIKKNKLGEPFHSGEFPLIFGKGIDYYQDLIQTATKLGVLIRKGAYYYFEGEQLGQGIENTINTLMSSPEILDKIEEMCYNVGIPTQKEEDSGN